MYKETTVAILETDKRKRETEREKLRMNLVSLIWQLFVMQKNIKEKNMVIALCAVSEAELSNIKRKLSIDTFIL